MKLESSLIVDFLQIFFEIPSSRLRHHLPRLFLDFHRNEEILLLLFLVELFFLFLFLLATMMLLLMLMMVAVSFEE